MTLSHSRREEEEPRFNRVW